MRNTVTNGGNAMNRMLVATIWAVTAIATIVMIMLDRRTMTIRHLSPGEFGAVLAVAFIGYFGFLLISSNAFGKNPKPPRYG